MLKIKIKTSEIELEFEDCHVTVDSYTKHSLPDNPIEVVTKMIEDVLKATNEIITKKRQCQD